jgi:SAM-dependent methyltransferase
VIAEGTPPERFALEHGHYDEDLPFWVALAQTIGGPVLDVGAAVGRVTIPIARLGHQVCAVDGSQGMLDALGAALAREVPGVAALVATARCDFRTLDLGDLRFPLVLMPMNSLQALLTREDQLACLVGIRRHLGPGGVFAFDVALPDLDAIAAALGQVQPGSTWTDPVSGATLAHSAWFDAVDAESGTVSFTTRIEQSAANGPTGTHLRPQTVHLFSPTELWELLHEAGLEVQAVYGDFDGTPLASGGERQIYRCGVAP